MKIINICLFLIFTVNYVYSQEKLEIPLINDRTYLSRIETEASFALKDKNWSISLLRNNIEKLKPSDRINFDLPKPKVKLLTSEEIYDRCSPSVIFVGRYYNCGNCEKMHTSLASGVILSNDGICVTNYHVLDEIIENKAESTNHDSLAIISTIDGKIYQITSVLSYSKEGDVAVFKVDTNGDKLPSIALGKPAKTGSKVHAITHPNGYYYYYSEGVVARNVAYSSDDENLNRMEITADYAKGSSGGPIFDSYGNLVGLVSQTKSVYYMEKEQKNLQMVIKSTIPVNTIRNLFRK